MAESASLRGERAAPAGGHHAVPDLVTLLAAPAPDGGALRDSPADLRAESVPGLLARLSFHRVEGLAHRALKRLDPGVRVDPWLRSALRRRHQRLAAATLAQGLALAELLEALQRAALPVVVMRGLHSVESIYGDPGARPFEDHDLLVRPGDRDGALGVLRRLGFEAQAPGLLRRGGVILDLHTDPLGACRRPTRGDVAPLPVEALFERARPGRIAGGPALLLQPEDDLLLLAIHLVKHSFDRLIRVADLAHLLARRASSLAWDKVRRRAEAANARRILAWALESCTLLGVDVPADLRPVEAGDSLMAVLLRRVLALRPLPYTGELLMALAAPSLRDRLRFLWEALLPPGESPEVAWSRAAAIPGRTAALLRQASRQIDERRRAR